MGEQAYRWLVTIGMALLTGLSWRVLTQVDSMSVKIEALQIQVTALSGTTEGRLNAHAERLTSVDRNNQDQNNAISDLQRRVWRLPELRTP